MRIAVLEVGRPPGDLAAHFGTYPDMYRQMLGLSEPLPAYDVAAGELPERPEAHDSYIVSGSPAGVYEPLPWIAGLLAFLRQARGRARLVGICFGHQAMAQAFGGRVTKSDKGWGVGLHEYAVVAREEWMDAALSVSIPASHQDQVVERPPGTIVTVASGFTPLAGLAWRDHPSISFQFHPEFSPAFAKALLETRRERVPDADSALASLDRFNDNERVGKWIAKFLAN
ncbi:MAG TPA: type 1 glutamine amidotransferase [Allosphingosinicella sp.]